MLNIFEEILTGIMLMFIGVRITSTLIELSKKYFCALFCKACPKIIHDNWHTINRVHCLFSFDIIDGTATKR